jgi:hypothetical protein
VDNNGRTVNTWVYIVIWQGWISTPQ